MRKVLLLLLSVLVIAVAALGFAGAGASGAATPGAEVYGAGSIGFPASGFYEHFDFSAHTGPNGDFGHSRLKINNPDLPLDVAVNVDCVNVFPTPLFRGAAWFAGAVTRVSPQPNYAGITPGTRLAFYVVDGGDPSETPVDDYEPFFEFANCKTLGFSGYDPIVTQGNIKISTG
jgi:hypothetical protein